MSCRDTVLHRTFYAITITFLVALVGCTSKAPAELPSVELFLLDSVTQFNAKNIQGAEPIVMFYFRPYCKHCRQETEDILTHYKEFNNIQLVFISADDLSEVKRFANYYNIGQYKNIRVAWDKDFNFQQTFKPKAIPYKVIYNGSKKLVRWFNGDTKWTQLLVTIKGV